MTNKDLIEQIELLIETGELQQALTLCNDALTEFPKEPTFHCLKGVAYQQLGELTKALYHHTQCVTIEPQYFICWSCISIIHLEMLEMEKAHHAILRALRAGPKQAEAWWLRAIFRELHGDTTGGERAYIHANWLNPDLVPQLPSLDEKEIHAFIFEACKTNSIELNPFKKLVDINCQQSPDIILLKETDQWESPIHLLFSFHEKHNRGTLTCYRQNIRRAVAEGEDIQSYLSTQIIPLVKDFLHSIYPG